MSSFRFIVKFAGLLTTKQFVHEKVLEDPCARIHGPVISLQSELSRKLMVRSNRFQAFPSLRWNN